MSSWGRAGRLSPVGIITVVVATAAALVVGLPEVIGSGRIASGDTMPFFDASDDQKLTDASSDVFVGKVRGKVGTEGLPTSLPGYVLPQTQFDIDVEDVMKGEAPRRVVVNQLGGRDAATGSLVLFDGDPLLKRGEEVLFFTIYNPDSDWYQIIDAGEGDRRIEGEPEKVELVETAEAAANWSPSGAVNPAHLFAPADQAESSVEDERGDGCGHAELTRSEAERPRPECFYPTPTS